MRILEMDGVEFMIDRRGGPDMPRSEANKFLIVKSDMVLEYISTLKQKQPQAVLELGFWQGGTLVYFDKLLQAKKIVGIDWRAELAPALDEYIKTHSNIKAYYKTAYNRPLARQIAREEFPDGIDFVLDGSTHMYEETKAAFEMLFPLVKPGGEYRITVWAWAHKKHQQAENGGWRDKTALMTLMFELLVLSGVCPAVESIHVTAGYAVIKRDRGPVPANLFDLRHISWAKPFRRCNRRSIGATREPGRFVMRTLRALSLAVALTVSAASGAPAESADYRGLYIYMTQALAKNSPWNEVYDFALRQDYVDGATISLPWSELETREGVFEWASLDRWLDQIVMRKKKLSIGLIAGGWTPDWVFDADVPDQGSDSFDRSAPKGVCVRTRAPAFWKPAFISAYSLALEAIAKHLREHETSGAQRGAAYAALTIAKISGVNLTTEETQIANHPAGGACHEPLTALAWAKAGYRPKEAEQGWAELADAAAKAFPGKLLSMAVIHKNAFPPIDEEGHLDAEAVEHPPAPDPMTRKLIAEGVAKFGSRLLVQWNALSQFRTLRGVPVLPPEVIEGKRLGAHIGWQVNGFMGVWEAAGCIYSPFAIRPCQSLDDFQAIFDNGVEAGAGYIEISPVNVSDGKKTMHKGPVRDYAPALVHAHERLRAAAP